MTNLTSRMLVLASIVALAGAWGCGDGNSGTDDGNNPDTIVADEGGTDTNVEDTNGTDTNVEDTNGTDTNVEDTNGTDTNVEDTNGTDTNVEDTNGTDTNVEDTNGTDTNVEDTNGTDTNVEDTNGTDTNVDDTNVTDTNPPECAANQQIVDLLALTEGPVDMTLCGVMVTKVTAKGWYIADDSTTRGMYIYEGSNPEWGYTVAVGDYVSMHVTTLGSFRGLQQITGKDTVTVQGSGDASVFTVDLSAGTVPTEDIESRVVKATGFEVTSRNGKSGTIAYGTATDVMVYVEYTDIPCIGMQGDVVSGVVSQYDANFQIVLTEEADLENVNVETCEEGPVFNMDNWDFEQQSVAEDPPEGFVKGTGNTYTCARVVDGGADGTAGIVLTWTSDTNQDLVQGYKYPTAEGHNVMVSVDLLDNDTAGRVRMGLAFQDVDGNFISGSSTWAADYSIDSASWQVLSHSAVAPAGAATATGTLRMYDYGAPNGTWDPLNPHASVTIDNWEMVSVAP